MKYWLTSVTVTILLVFVIRSDAQRTPKTESIPSPSPEISVTKKLPPNYPKPVDGDQIKVIYDFCGWVKDSDVAWLAVMKDLEAYPKLYSNQPGYNIFYNQLYEIGKISYENRQSQGGWAGNFVLASFQNALFDIQKNPNLWGEEYYSAEKGETEVLYNCVDILEKEGIIKLPQKLKTVSDWGNVIVATFTGRDACIANALGKRHIERHLEPAFDCYIGGLLATTIKKTPANKRYEAVRDALLNLRKEHRLFIEKAVIPGFKKNPAVDKWDKFFANLVVPNEVDSLREKIVEKYLKGFQANGDLTKDEVDKILTNHSICHCVY